jgi:hypothetical protein
VEWFCGLRKTALRNLWNEALSSENDDLLIEADYGFGRLTL